MQDIIFYHASKKEPEYSFRLLKYIIIVFGVILISFFNIFVSLVLCLFLVTNPYFLKKKVDVFQPENYFFCWYFYYFGIGFFAYQIRYFMGLNPGFDERVLLKGMIYSIVIAIFIKIFLRIYLKPIKNIMVNNFFRMRSLSLLLIITFVNSALNMFYWHQLGGIPIFIPGFHSYQKAELGIGLGYIEYLQNFITLVVIFFIVIQWNDKKNNYFKLLLILYNTVFLALMSDSRGAAISSVLVMLILYSWNRKRIGLFKIIVLGILLVFSATAWGALRNNISLLYSGMIFMAEIATEFDNYLHVIDIFPSRMDFQYGGTLVSCIALLVPRVLLPNKNDFLTGGEFLRDVLGLEHIRVGVRMTILGEMYMNFGYLGGVFSIVVLLFFLYLMKIFYKGALRTNSYISYWMAIIMLFAAQSFLVGDMATAFTFTFYNIVFISCLVVLLIIAKNVREYYQRFKNKACDFV